MVFLKWFSFIWILLSVLFGLYEAGEKEHILVFVLILLIYIPILTYIFLS